MKKFKYDFEKINNLLNTEKYINRELKKEDEEIFNFFDTVIGYSDCTGDFLMNTPMKVIDDALDIINEEASGNNTDTIRISSIIRTENLKSLCEKIKSKKKPKSSDLF